MNLKKRFTLSLKNNLRFLPDRAYINLYYKFKLGYFPDIDNPKMFNEKLQWMKLNYRDERLPHLVDKSEVREYVRERIGEQYLVPMLGLYQHPEEIDWDALPKAFVVKCTHDSQSTFVCDGAGRFDAKDVTKRLAVALKRNWYWQGREWAYRDCKPRVIVEQYLREPGKLAPNDYKCYCFNGKVAMIQADADRFTECHKEQFFSPEWESWGDWDHSKIPDEDIIEAPSRLSDMIRLSEALSEDFPHVRVDWYCFGETLLFGELTFYTGGGFDPFHAKEDCRNDALDRYLGDLFVLPNK